jgi:alkylation response protein AidB-like acyl-CoA dehydrogenase
MINKKQTKKFMGIEIPQELGGSGMRFFNSIIAIEEFAKVDSAMGGLVDLQNTVVNTLLLHNGSHAHLEKYCPKLAQNMVLYSLLFFFQIK